MTDGPSLGHFLSMAGIRLCMSMFLYTSCVTDSVGLISIAPLGLFFESLWAATLFMKGKFPIFPSKIHCPCVFHLGLATAPKNIAFGMNFDDFAALYGIFSLCAR
ncbi:unnamed protein product [Amaranthus hypochondriacus]